MLTYLVKRLMVSIVVLLGIALGTFLMIHLIPGDPAKIELGIHATPAAVEHLHHEWGLNRSLPEQFWLYLGNIVTFSFGQSTGFSSGVTELIGQRRAAGGLRPSPSGWLDRQRDPRPHHLHLRDAALLARPDALAAARLRAQ